MSQCACDANRGPIRLADLPPEIWGSIIPLLVFKHLMRLKATGHKRLWGVLCSPRSVTDVRLDFISSHFNRLPPCLNDLLGLIKLNISFTNDSENIGTVLNFSNIPVTVRNLQITGDDPFSLTESLSHLASQPHGESIILNLVSLEIKASIDPHTQWVTKLPANLKKLNVLCWDPSIALPAGLQVLKVQQSTDLSISAHHLPPNLRKLELNTSFFNLVSLPTSLKTLTLLNYAEPIPPEVFSLIPSRLKHLIFPGVSFDENSQFAWPHRLKELECDDLPVKLWTSLPQSLKRLRISCATVNRPENGLFLVPFENLPVSLTQLHISHLSYDFVASNTSQWPCAALSDLMLGGVLLSPNSISSLPPTLISAHLSQVDGSTASLLPSNMINLVIGDATIDGAFVAGLPRKLRYLHIGQHPTTYLFHHNTQSWEHIGRGAECALITETEAIWKQHVLPPHLVTLILDPFINLGDDFVASLSRDLTLLSINSTKTITDAGLQYLPPHLTVLRMTGATKVTSASFESLPRGLKSFCLNVAEEIFDRHISALPRGLTFINFSQAIHLTNDCIKHLPESLKTALMNNNDKITPESWPDFPQPMRDQCAGTSFYNRVFYTDQHQFFVV